MGEVKEIGEQSELKKGELSSRNYSGNINLEWRKKLPGFTTQFGALPIRKFNSFKAGDDFSMERILLLK